MNRQALPDGTYNVRNGRWELVRLIAQDILSAQATASDLFTLAEVVKEAKASGADVKQVAEAVEDKTVFSDLARTFRNFDREHPPSWGAWVLAMIVPYIISAIIGLLHDGSPSEPAVRPTHTQAVQNLSPEQIRQLAQQIASDLERQHIGDQSHPSRPPGRNERCWCGSGMKYKKCCGDPAKRSP